MQNSAEAWFSQRTSNWRDWPLPQLMSWKQGQAIRISVVIPARNEERTVGGVVSAVRNGTMELLQFVREGGVLRRRPRLVPAVERPLARSVRAAAG